MAAFLRLSGWGKRGVYLVLAIAINLAVIWLLFSPLRASGQAPSLSFRDPTWEIIGLDQGSAVFGPQSYLVGANLCNNGGESGAITATLDLEPGSGTIQPSGPTSLSIPSLAADECTGVYYNVDIVDENLATAIGAVQPYTISVTAANFVTETVRLNGSLEVAGLAPRNQAINVDQAIYQLDGPAQVTVGNVYQYVAQVNGVITDTTQLVHQVNFPAEIFRITGIEHTADMADGSGRLVVDGMYADACNWNPADNTCGGSGRVDGNSRVVFTVEVLSPGEARLEHLVYGHTADGFYYLADHGTDTINVVAAGPTATLTPTITTTVTTTPTVTSTATLTPSVTTTPPTNTPTVTNTPGTPTVTTTPPTRTPTRTSTATPNLTINFTANPRNAVRAQNVTYTAQVRNNGNADATNVTMTVSFSTYLDIRTVTVQNGTYSTNTSTRTVTASLGTITPGNSKTVTIVTMVNNTLNTTTTATNSATVRYNDTRTATSSSVSVQLVGTSTLPNTGGMQIDNDQGGPNLFWPAVLTASLLGLTGIASIAYSFRAKTTRPLWSDWYLKTGIMLLVVGGVFGLVSQIFLPGRQPEPTQVAQAPFETSLTPSPGNGADEEEPLQMWWPSSTPEPETLPDYPIPTPSVAAGEEGESGPDTSAVNQITIPQLELNTVVKYVPYDGFTWMIAGLQNEIAWMGDSSWPGLGGNTALAGHVTLRNGALGPFYGLPDLEENAEVILYTEQNVYTYRVREKRQVEETDLSAIAPSEKAQVTLITCSDWNEDTELYEKRYVVTAELVDVKPRPQQQASTFK